MCAIVKQSSDKQLNLLTKLKSQVWQRKDGMADTKLKLFFSFYRYNHATSLKCPAAYSCNTLAINV